MNSKTGIIIGVIVVMLLGIGGFVYFSSNSGSKSTKTGTEALTQEKSINKQPGMFSSIKDALSKNLSLQCNIKDTATGNETVSYIKNGMIRVNVAGKTPDEAGSVIMRDNKMYFWNDKSAIMMTFDINEAQKTDSANAPEGSTSQNPQEYITMMEKYKQSCKTALIADSLFTVPANVKFQDLSQMMKNLQKSTGTGSTTPGANVPAADQAQYEELMKQYGNPQP